MNKLIISGGFTGRFTFLLSDISSCVFAIGLFDVFFFMFAGVFNGAFAGEVDRCLLPTSISNAKQQNMFNKIYI